jgi:MFS transporter, Spinster family, sphingosine-1-phosphate transporter
MTAMTFGIGGVSFWMPHYLSEYRQVGSLANATFIFGIVSAVAGLSATILGGLAGDWLRKRAAGAYFIVSGVGILLACPFVLLMLVTPFPVAWIMLFFAVFFLFFNTGPANAILANVTHPNVRATAFAMNIFLIHALGDALSPPLLGAIVGNTHRWNMAFFVVVSVMALAGGLWLVGARFLDTDTKRASLEPTLEPGFAVIPIDRPASQ